MGMFVWIAVWFFGALLAGHIAYYKGRNQAMYILISVVLSPLVGVIMAIAAKPEQDVLEKRELEKGQRKQCPACAELVKVDARVCKHCGNGFS